MAGSLYDQEARNRPHKPSGGNSGSATISSYQLFDTSALTWSGTTTNLPAVREGHTATKLANGNVLVTGGQSGTTTLNTTLLFNAASGSGGWASAGAMTSARSSHTATSLPMSAIAAGKVLVAGGSSGTSALGASELWDGTITWTASSALPAAVQGHAAGPSATWRLGYSP